VKAIVHVTLKPEVLDPQGQAIARACASLGYAGVRAVRQGKVFEVEVDAPDEPRARALVTELCEKLLANPVIEDFCIAELKR
jgi:phosphoribosylformylglycinamidine synthase